MQTMPNRPSIEDEAAADFAYEKDDAPPEQWESRLAQLTEYVARKHRAGDAIAAGTARAVNIKVEIEVSVVTTVLHDELISQLVCNAIARGGEEALTDLDTVEGSADALAQEDAMSDDPDDPDPDYRAAIAAAQAARAPALLASVGGYGPTVAHVEPVTDRLEQQWLQEMLP